MLGDVDEWIFTDLADGEFLDAHVERGRACNLTNSLDSSRRFDTTTYKLGARMLGMSIRIEHIEVPQDVGMMLGQNERVVARAKQSRFLPGGKEVNPGEVFITNTRLVFYNHKFFGRGTITDLHYGDVSNVKVNKGLWSAEIIVVPRFERVEHVKISAVKKDKVYEIVQLINNGIEMQGRRI